MARERVSARGAFQTARRPAVPQPPSAAPHLAQELCGGALDGGPHVPGLARSGRGGWRAVEARRAAQLHCLCHTAGRGEQLHALRAVDEAAAGAHKGAQRSGALLACGGGGAGGRARRAAACVKAPGTAGGAAPRAAGPPRLRRPPVRHHRRPPCPPGVAGAAGAAPKAAFGPLPPGGTHPRRHPAAPGPGPRLPGPPGGAAEGGAGAGARPARAAPASEPGRAGRGASGTIGGLPHARTLGDWGRAGTQAGLAHSECGRSGARAVSRARGRGSLHYPQPHAGRGRPGTRLSLRAPKGAPCRGQALGPFAWGAPAALLSW